MGYLISAVVHWFDVVLDSLRPEFEVAELFDGITAQLVVGLVVCVRPVGGTTLKIANHNILNKK